MSRNKHIKVHVQLSSYNARVWVTHLSIKQVCVPSLLENTLPYVCGPSVPTCWQLAQQRATYFSTTTGLEGINFILVCCTHCVHTPLWVECQWCACMYMHIWTQENSYPWEAYQSNYNWSLEFWGMYMYIHHSYTYFSLSLSLSLSLSGPSHS